MISYYTYTINLYCVCLYMGNIRELHVVPVIVIVLVVRSGILVEFVGQWVLLENVT